MFSRIIIRRTYLGFISNNCNIMPIERFFEYKFRDIKEKNTSEEERGREYVWEREYEREKWSTGNKASFRGAQTEIKLSNESSFTKKTQNNNSLFV